MANPDPLAQLKDIHLPDPVGWWPLAPGWYALLVISLFVIGLIMYQSYKRHRAALAKKRALVLLKQYHDAYKKEANAPLISAHISALLRRVALAYYPRQQVASLSGEAWLHFLNDNAKGLDFGAVRAQLLDAPFRKDKNMDLNPLFDIAQRWIKQRRIPCSN